MMKKGKKLMKKPTKYMRILIKFSGEILSDSPERNYTLKALQKIASSLKGLSEASVEYGIVVGAGNLFRGLDSTSFGIDQVPGDQVGMLGTIMNSIMLREILEQFGITAHVMAPQCSIPSVLPLETGLARKFISQKEPVIFAGGTGNPFFTTDSAATLRALEIHASLLVKATKVNGVYNSDPMLKKDALRFSQITYQEALQGQFKIMDQPAFALAMQYNLPIFVYKFGDPLSILEAINTEGVGTLIT
jgi:uridylate kinase